MAADKAEGSELLFQFIDGTGDFQRSSVLRIDEVGPVHMFDIQKKSTRNTAEQELLFLSETQKHPWTSMRYTERMTGRS